MEWERDHGLCYGGDRSTECASHEIVINDSLMVHCEVGCYF